MKKILLALVITVVFAATLSANGTSENSIYGGGYGQGSGQGLRDGSGAGRGNGTGQGQGYGRAQGTAGTGYIYRENFVEELAAVYQAELGSGVLSKTETEGLILMVEEEKLARDVYAELYEKWQIPVFMNIADSEQQHMDAVKLVLDAYNVDAPAKTMIAGKFENSELQTYYDKLVSEGKASIEAAMNVGATIEDLDIADLQKLLDKTENEEVAILYQNLMKGSRNHMRSFAAQLDRYGESYTPVYISGGYYDKILKYNREIAPISDPDYSI